MKSLLIATCMAAGAFALSSCATISEEECLAGGWEDIGFRDGESGKSQARLADYNTTCSEFAVTPNRSAYLRGYDQGLSLYCSYDTGLNHGETGHSADSKCQAFPESGYFAGYEDGRVTYDLYSERDRMVDRYDRHYEALIGTRNNMKKENISDREIRRLRKKAARIEVELEDMKVDIRVFERLNNLSEADIKALIS